MLSEQERVQMFAKQVDQLASILGVEVVLGLRSEQVTGTDGRPEIKTGPTLTIRALPQAQQKAVQQQAATAEDTQEADGAATD